MDPLAPGAHESWWIRTSAARRYEALEADLQSEVCIVGAGIVGVCTALELARRGVQVVVLEAGEVLAGVTGHTTAKVSVGHNLIYADLRARHGEDAAALYAQGQLAGLGWIASQPWAAASEVEVCDSLVYTESPAEREQVEAEVAACLRCGIPAQIVEESSLPYLITAGAVIGDQLQFHPRKFLLHALAELEALGGRVRTQTRVRGVEEDGDDVVVYAESGASVRAQHCVLATHYPILDRGLTFPRLQQYRDVVVTAPILASRAPREIAISTGAEPGGTHSVRSAPYPDDPRRRLLIVTGSQYKTGSEEGVEAHYRELADWMRMRFPVEDVVCAWSTQDTSSPDRLPLIGRLPNTERTWVATGFSAWGMTNGVMSAKLLADLITETPNPWEELYNPSRTTLSGGARKLLRENLEVARHLVTGLLRGDGDPAALDPGQAGVFRQGVHERACYRDEAGGFHVVSARCTHMGCTVAWNDAERSWDCPCHGSRFDHEGNVLHGPATRPLERIDPGELVAGEHEEV